MKQVVFFLMAISLVIGIPGMAACGGDDDGEPVNGATPNDELLDLPPEEVLGNLFSLESWAQQDQYWEEYEGKRVEWVGKVHNKESIDSKVAVSLDYACQPSQLAHRNLRAGVILYLGKSEAMNLVEGQKIAYTGHLCRRLYWDRLVDRPGDPQELQFELGYGSASAVTVEDAEVVD